MKNSNNRKIKQQEYIKKRRQKYKLEGKCISCGKEKENQQSYKCDKCKSNDKKYKKSNKGKLSKKRENEKYRQNPQYRITNRIRHKKKLETDIQYKLKHMLRTRLRTALKNNQKNGSAVHDLGCTIPQLKLWLEMNFEDGMNWDNWATDGWHIDHIKPLHMFDLTDKEQLLEVCHYTNLRPMWAKDNLSRTYEEFKRKT